MNDSRDCNKISGRNALAGYYMKIGVLKGVLFFCYNKDIGMAEIISMQCQCGHK